MESLRVTSREPDGGRHCIERCRLSLQLERERESFLCPCAVRKCGGPSRRHLAKQVPHFSNRERSAFGIIRGCAGDGLYRIRNEHEGIVIKTRGACKHSARRSCAHA